LISEIFLFTPSEIFELTLPQFLLYARYANEQKVYKLDLKTVDAYVGAIFGKAQPEDPHAKKIAGLPTITACKNEFDNKVNNIYNIRDARNSLRRRTGKKEFDMKDIIAEIQRMKPSDKFKMSEVEYKAE